MAPAVRLSFAMQTLEFAQQFSGVGRAHERLPDQDGVHPLIHQGSHLLATRKFRSLKPERVPLSARA